MKNWNKANYLAVTRALALILVDQALDAKANRQVVHADRPKESTVKWGKKVGTQNEKASPTPHDLLCTSLELATQPCESSPPRRSPEMDPSS